MSRTVSSAFFLCGELADLEENAGQAEAAARIAAAAANEVAAFERRKPARRPLPEHLPRELIVYRTAATHNSM